MTSTINRKQPKRGRNATGLPDIASLPLHKYNPSQSADGHLKDLAYPPPRENPMDCPDYVLALADCEFKPPSPPSNSVTCTLANLRIFKNSGEPSNRGAKVCDNDTGATLDSKTVAHILGTSIPHNVLCDICENTTTHCAGAPCVRTFQALQRKIADCYVEIRPAGNASIGVGVFAKVMIPKDTILCEYMGRLVPLDAKTPIADPTYVFHHAGACYIDARVYGNVARFVNHHCTRYNADVVEVMYGKRRVLVYKTNRDVAAGSELFVTYGSGYWTADRLCQCDAVPYPHLIKEDKNGRWSVMPSTKTAVKSKQATWDDAPFQPNRPVKPVDKASPHKPDKLTRPAGVTKNSKRRKSRL